jgi:hypothetical protein
MPGAAQFLLDRSEDTPVDNRLESIRYAQPFRLGRRLQGRVELGGGAAVDVGADVLLVTQDLENVSRKPRAACTVADSEIIQTPCNAAALIPRAPYHSNTFLTKATS